MERARWSVFPFLIVALAFATGCVTGTSDPPAFSADWIRKHGGHQSQNPNPGDQGELTLLGKGKGPRMYLYADEKGKPRLAIGGRGGLSADLDIRDGEPAFKVKYKLKLGGKRRRFYAPPPPAPPTEPPSAS